MMSRLKIKIKHNFIIYQNLWTRNSFHLNLKLGQVAVVCYAVSVFLANTWACIRDNQISTKFSYISFDLENYLTLSLAKDDVNGNKDNDYYCGI